MEKETKHTPDLYLVTNPGQIHLRDRNDSNKTFITIEDWHNSPETIAKLELIVEAVNSFQNLKWKCSIWEPKINELAEEVSIWLKQAESLQTELSEMKKENTSLQSENTRLKSELLHRDITVLPQKDFEFEEMKASLQSEIDRLNQENEELKDNYEGMTSHCKYLTEINVFNMAFDKADEHWRKAHKVEEGENFIDWYLRYQAAEREADRKQLSEMKKENKRLDDALFEISSVTVEGLIKQNSEMKKEREELKAENIHLKKRIDSDWYVRELNNEISEMKKQIDEFHNSIMTQWEKDYGSIHNEQKMDAYTLSGFIKSIISRIKK